MLCEHLRIQGIAVASLRSPSIATQQLCVPRAVCFAPRVSRGKQENLQTTLACACLSLDTKHSFVIVLSRGWDKKLANMLRGSSTLTPFLYPGQAGDLEQTWSTWNQMAAICKMIGCSKLLRYRYRNSNCYSIGNEKPIGSDTRSGCQIMPFWRDLIT